MQFWTDNKIIEEYTVNDRFFYLYLLTNPRTSLCGCYEISKKQAILETGLTIAEIDETLDRLENLHGVVRYSPETREVLLVNWYKYNWTTSGKTGIGVLKGINNVKNEEFKTYLQDIFDIVYEADAPCHIYTPCM